MAQTLAALIERAEGTFIRVLRTHPEVQKALVYADAAHRALDQRRKYTGKPYIEHPRMVASLLLLPRPDPDKIIPALQAALLHDVVEDTSITLDDLSEHFDGRVVSLVSELTEPDSPDHWYNLGIKRPNRATRRAQEVERRATISPTGQTISCADIIANSHDIVDVADKEFALMYQGELMDRLQAMTRADPVLWDLAHATLSANLKRLELTNA